MADKYKKIIDISGYSFSGKSLVYSYLESHERIHGFGLEFEYELLRAPGGINELYDALVCNWSPIRSSDAISRFIALSNNMGGSKRFTDRLFHLNWYEHHFPNFQKHIKEYIECLCVGKWVAEWPYATFQFSRNRILLEKIKNRIKGSGSFNEVFLSRLSKEEFIDITNKFLSKTFNHVKTNKQFFLINNCFEPFNPSHSMNFIKNSICIIVDRDPRDIYLSALKSHKSISKNAGTGVVGKSVYDFIDKFKLMRVNKNDTNKNICRITFEDFILDPEKNLIKLSDVIGIDIRNKDQLSILKKSETNIGMYKYLQKDSDRDVLNDISIIEEELEEFCVY